MDTIDKLVDFILPMVTIAVSKISILRHSDIRRRMTDGRGPAFNVSRYRPAACKKCRLLFTVWLCLSSTCHHRLRICLVTVSTLSCYDFCYRVHYLFISSLKVRPLYHIKGELVSMCCNFDVHHSLHCSVDNKELNNIDGIKVVAHLI